MHLRVLCYYEYELEEVLAQFVTSVIIDTGGVTQNNEKLRAGMRETCIGQTERSVDQLQNKLVIPGLICTYISNIQPKLSGVEFRRNG